MKEKINKFCFWLFVFGFVYAFFHVMPALLPSFLKSPLTWGDTLDFVTPFAVIPLVYLLLAVDLSVLFPVGVPLVFLQRFFSYIE